MRQLRNITVRAQKTGQHGGHMDVLLVLQIQLHAQGPHVRQGARFSGGVSRTVGQWENTWNEFALECI